MTAQATPAPILLDCHEAAALLGVSLRKFRDMTKDPSFPAGRALGPRSTRWHRGELEQFAAGLPTIKRDEPAHLTAARAARSEGKPTAHAPFPPGPAPKPRTPAPWNEVG